MKWRIQTFGRAGMSVEDKMDVGEGGYVDVD
jgi:hypothetical protein